MQQARLQHPRGVQEVLDLKGPPNGDLRVVPHRKCSIARLDPALLDPALLKAVIGAVMRKLAHPIYGVIKSGKPFDLKKAMPTLDFQDGN